MFVIFVTIFCLVMTQPLETTQLGALMDIYDGLGAFLHQRSHFPDFFFAFFFSLQVVARPYVLDSIRCRIVLDR